MTGQTEVQTRFFQYLNHRFPTETVLQETMKVLHLKKGATYKRMNGDTALTSEELFKLATHFKISLDTALGNERYITVQHPFLMEKTGINFLDMFAHYLKPLLSSEDSKLTYLANELPVFYYFSHKYIFNFLNAVWGHLHWENHQLKIELDVQMDYKIEKMRNEVLAYYDSHPVTEIWNSNMLANLYQQIFFSISTRAFSDVSFIDHLIKDIEKLIRQLRDLASTGEKKQGRTTEGTELKIYLNEFGNFQNIVLYESETIKTVFLGFDMPQFMVTHSRTFFKYSQSWIEKIRHRSVQISSDGYRYRELFFMTLEADFEAFKKKAEKLVDVYYS